ncbi:hypothetical protein U0070_013859 [Myodes glareolus]|uniref:Vomeronasal type-1 receptor n=1 Tax=Myodes glareolus TaxID=447135 RepID=A0AAW0H395_MYOGA
MIMLPSVMKINEIYTHVIIKKNCYFQIGLRISAITFLLLFHVFMVLQDCRAKPTELNTCHLTIVWTVMLFTALDFWSLDMFRVMRDLFICITCFLSGLQATIISPSTDWVVKTKHILTNYIKDVFFVGLMMFSSAYMAITASPQKQPLCKTLARAKSHLDHPGSGECLCGHILDEPHHFILIKIALEELLIGVRVVGAAAGGGAVRELGPGRTLGAGGGSSEPPPPGL